MVERGQFNGAQAWSRSYGLPAFAQGVVGERSHAREAAAEASRGGMGSENAGMSNERGVKNPSAECLRVPE